MRTWQSGHGSQLFTTVPVPGMLCIIVYPDHWNEYFECDVVILPVTEYINCLLIATVSDVPDIPDGAKCVNVPSNSMKEIKKY